VRRTLPLTLALVAAALAAGCMTPTPQQVQSAKASRAEAQDLLDSFALCMRQKDSTGLRPLVAPSLSPSQFLPLALKLPEVLRRLHPGGRAGARRGELEPLGHRPGRGLRPGV